MAAIALKEAGNNAFKRGNYDEAVTCYGEAMKLDPSESTYPLNRSMAYLKLERYTEAERDATKSLNLLPAGNVKALFRRGIARRALGRLDSAKQDLQAALQEEPGNQGVKTELASLEREIADRRASDLKKGKAKESSDKATAVPPAASTNNVKAKQDKLKAAITPETSSEAADGPALLAPVSTRVLKPSGKSILSNTSISDSGPQAQSRTGATATTKKDFVSMRNEREQRIKATAAALTPPIDTKGTTRKDMGRNDISKTLARTSFSPPQSTFEFERRWKDSPDQQSRLGILESISDASVSLPDLFGSNLSPEVVDDVLSCLKDRTEAPDTALYFLENLPKCQRFDFVSMLSGETSAIRQILPPNDVRASAIYRAWGV